MPPTAEKEGDRRAEELRLSAYILKTVRRLHGSRGKHTQQNSQGSLTGPCGMKHFVSAYDTNGACIKGSGIGGEKY
jgi:hypothetical protein